MFRLQQVADFFMHDVVNQDRAEERLFGFQIMRGRARRGERTVTGRMAKREDVGGVFGHAAILAKTAARIIPLNNRHAPVIHQPAVAQFRMVLHEP